ncbi:MAG: hypothetical protein WAL45_12845, partial [Terracidiphilus sp.]
FQRDFADGLRCCGHFDLLETQPTDIAMSATATLVTGRLNMTRTVGGICVTKVAEISVLFA